MLYKEVFDVINSYDRANIPLFADHWERFPDENTAALLADSLDKKAIYYRKFDEALSIRITNAADELRRRANIEKR